MRTNRGLRRRAVHAIGLLTCWVVMPMAVHAGESGDGMPPSGLYRIDTIGSMNVVSPAGTAGVRTHRDGATGNEVHQSHGNGHTVERTYPGSAPVTQCVGPRQGGVPPGMPTCVNQSSIRTPDGWVLKMKCASVENTTTIRRIDAVTWEYDIASRLFQPAAADMSGMRAIIAHQASNAPTAKEREAAAKALAELPAMQRGMAQGQVETLQSLAKMEAEAKTPEELAMVRAARERMAGNAPMQEHAAKMRWTRIADTCEAGAKAR